MKLNNKKEDSANRETASLLLPGIFLMAGFWGTAVQELQLGMQGYLMILPGVLALCAGLYLRWEKRWHAWMILGILLLFVMNFLWQF